MKTNVKKQLSLLTEMWAGIFFDSTIRNKNNDKNTKCFLKPKVLAQISESNLLQ